MAGLTGALIATREIVTNGGTFDVRGVAVDEIASLFLRRRDEIEDLFARIFVAAKEGDGVPSMDHAEAIVGRLLIESPAIVAELIAMAAGPVTDETVAIARCLPAPVQIAALEAIAELTFTSEMPPKKVLETVVKALGGLASLLPGQAVLPNGFGASDDR